MKIPNQVIYAVSDVIGSWYYSHSKLDTLFGESGAPGEPPKGNCIRKCQDWFKRANSDESNDPISVLTGVLEEFMSLELGDDPRWRAGYERVNRSLLANGLAFERGSVVPIAKQKRFRVALSFPGERRLFVESVAERLAARVQRHRVLYDRWFEAEFARPNLDTHLQRLYHHESELIAVFLCKEYQRKDWCGLEWRALRDLIKQRHMASVMPLRFDTVEIPGLFSIDGYVWIGDRTPEDIAEVILSRLGEGQSTHSLVSDMPQSTALPAPTASPTSRALLVWKEKLDYLLEEEAKITDLDQKFRVRKLVEEARAKIREHQG